MRQAQSGCSTVAPQESCRNWLGWVELRRCAFLESLNVGWNDGPRLRRSRPDMSGDLQPGWIVESAAGYPSGSGPSLHRPRNGGAASRTELQTEPAVGLVRAMFIRRQRPARELDLLELEQGRLGERAAGASLTERAVADGRQHWFADRSVANAAA